MSLTRILQWVGIALVLAALVGLNYDFDSEAGMRMNAPVEDPLSQGLLGYWKMDEGTGTSTTADASGNGNNLTMTNMEVGDWVAGNIGPYSLDFDGSNEYLTVASPSGVLDFADGASFSITGWFNRDTFANDHTIVAKRNGQTATDDGYIVYIDDATDTLVFEASDTADTDEYQRVSNSTFTATGWHQFAVTWNDSATTDPVNIFIDGALNNGTATGTFANIGDLTESVAFRIGAESDAGLPFDGKIDDVRIYGYPLSAGDVLKLYQTTAPAQPVDTGLVGHWTFDGPDIAGTTAIDKSGKGNHGSITGAVPTIGKLGQGMNFNGTSDYMDVGDVNLTDGASQLTVSVWLYDDSSGGDSSYPVSPIISKYTSITGNWNFRLGGSTDYMVFAFDFSNYGYSSSYSHDVDIWEHWVAVFDGAQTGNSNRLKIYKNGELDTDGFGGTIPATTSSDSNTVRIGSRPDGGYYWDGKIDDVRVYTRALLESEVKSLFYGGR